MLILARIHAEVAADQALWIAAKQGGGENWTEPWPTSAQSQVDLDERLDAEPVVDDPAVATFKRLMGMV